ncbi:MAG: hypothetical protein FIA99_09585 [Ruminiclostridium sp.]|nr:hypothetical protein [Ruminiclostridium sp.]
MAGPEEYHEQEQYNKINTFYISRSDSEELRNLACKVAFLAARPGEDVKRDLWYEHNSLKATRPVILCHPQNGWKEIITEKQLKCKGKLARYWEYLLRREVFWGEYMGDDKVIEPHFYIPYLFTESDWGMHETYTGGKDGGSYRWEAPLSEYANAVKLHFRSIAIDFDRTGKLFNLAGEVLGDLLEIRSRMIWWWNLGLTCDLIRLRGLEQIMFDMYDFPDELHGLMSFLRDEQLTRLEFLENNRLLFANNDSTPVGSGGFGYTNDLPQKDFDCSRVRTCDMWGHLDSQETSQISVRMFEEFVFPYQLPIAEKFGLICYGCCESLTNRWQVIRKIPNLRRVSVSPWANPDDMAEKLGNSYIYSMKPHPADLAVSNLDEENIREKMRNALKVTRNCRVEVIMKDNNTICNNAQNVIRWCKIAMEEAEAL